MATLICWVDETDGSESPEGQQVVCTTTPRPANRAELWFARFGLVNKETQQTQAASFSSKTKTMAFSSKF
jgi:hypothetical protein